MVGSPQQLSAMQLLCTIGQVSALPDHIVGAVTATSFPGKGV